MKVSDRLRELREQRAQADARATKKGTGAPTNAAPSRKKNYKSEDYTDATTDKS